MDSGYPAIPAIPAEPEAPIAIPFINGWKDNPPDSQPYLPSRYWRRAVNDALGSHEIYLQLFMDGRTSTSQVAFQLPAGYFDPTSWMRGPFSYWTGAAWALGQWRILLTGHMEFWNNADTARAANSYVSLQLMFRVPVVGD